MKKTLLDRITAAEGRTVKHGVYSYKMDVSGRVYRAKTANIGRAWIAADGTQFDAWEPIEQK